MDGSFPEHEPAGGCAAVLNDRWRLPLPGLKRKSSRLMPGAFSFWLSCFPVLFHLQADERSGIGVVHPDVVAAVEGGVIRIGADMLIVFRTTPATGSTREM